MRLTVRLFAGLRERAGTDRLEVELPAGATVADLLAAMGETPVGALAPRACVVAVNRTYAAPGDAIAEGDEVALVPPVSGGRGGGARCSRRRRGRVRGRDPGGARAALRGVRRDGRRPAAGDRRGGGGS